MANMQKLLFQLYCLKCLNLQEFAVLKLQKKKENVNRIATSRRIWNIMEEKHSAGF